VNGNPLVTSVSDGVGTVTTTVDLLGRVVAYTDVNGVRTETSYDLVGRAQAEKVFPPNPADAPQEVKRGHDDAGRPTTVTLGTTTLATATYTAAGELQSVTYANGSSLAAIGRNDTGATTSHTWRTADGTSVVSSVTRTRAGSTRSTSC
jgi:YD repeat-containing protein